MTGKLIPIPTENIGAVRVALTEAQGRLRKLMNDRNPTVAKAAQIDYAALVWARDNLDERPEVEIYDGH